MKRPTRSIWKNFKRISIVKHLSYKSTFYKILFVTRLFYLLQDIAYLRILHLRINNMSIGITWRSLLHKRIYMKKYMPPLIATSIITIFIFSPMLAMAECTLSHEECHNVYTCTEYYPNGTDCKKTI